MSCFYFGSDSAGGDEASALEELARAFFTAVLLCAFVAPLLELCVSKSEVKHTIRNNTTASKMAEKRKAVELADDDESSDDGLLAMARKDRAETIKKRREEKRAEREAFIEEDTDNPAEEPATEAELEVAREVFGAAEAARERGAAREDASGGVEEADAADIEEEERAADADAAKADAAEGAKDIGDDVAGDHYAILDQLQPQDAEDARMIAEVRTAVMNAERAMKQMAEAAIDEAIPDIHGEPAISLRTGKLFDTLDEPNRSKARAALLKSVYWKARFGEPTSFKKLFLESGFPVNWSISDSDIGWFMDMRLNGRRDRDYN